MENDDGSYVEEMVRSIEDLSSGTVEASEFVRRSLRGLEVVHAQKGLLRCKFVIPNGVSVGQKPQKRKKEQKKDWSFLFS